jgi:hypothetical protein
MKFFTKTLLGLAMAIVFAFSSAYANDEVKRSDQIPDVLSGIELTSVNEMSDHEKDNAQGTFDVTNIPNYLAIEGSIYGLYDVNLVYRQLSGNGPNFISVSLRDMFGPQFPADVH